MTAAEAGTYTWDTTGPYVGDCITNIIYTCFPLQSQAAISHIVFKIMPEKKSKLKNIPQRLMCPQRLTSNVPHFRMNVVNDYWGIDKCLQESENCYSSNFSETAEASQWGVCHQFLSICELKAKACYWHMVSVESHRHSPCDDTNGFVDYRSSLSFWMSLSCFFGARSDHIWTREWSWGVARDVSDWEPKDVMHAHLYKQHDYMW